MEQAQRNIRRVSVSPALTSMAEQLGSGRRARKAVMDRYRGLWSYKQIAAWIAAEFGLTVSPLTVRKWCLRWDKGGEIVIREPLKGGKT